jgi:hypothetical protein
MRHGFNPQECHKNKIKLKKKRKRKTGLGGTYL